MPATVEEYLKWPHSPADHRVAYGTDSEQFGDLYLPRRPGNHPVVIALHGGCWSSAYDLLPLSALCAALAAEGFAVWNLEYRRLGNGGGWPGTFHDVAAGADFLPTIAKRYALDLRRVVTLGHSAGGQLALWLAARLRVPRDSEISTPHPLGIHAVLSLAGIADLAEGARLKLCGTACAELLGGTAAELPVRRRSASPVALLPFGIPQRHIVGRLDKVVPVEYLERYIATAARHDDARLLVLPDAGHFEPVMPAGAAWDAVRDVLREWSR